MTLLSFAASGSVKETPANSALDMFNYTDGATGSRVAAIRSPGLGAFELDDIADWWKCSNTAPATDGAWLCEDIKVTELDYNDGSGQNHIWSAYLSGRRLANQTHYAYCFNRESFADGGQLRLDLYTILMDNSGQPSTWTEKATGTSGFIYDVGTVYRIAIRLDDRSSSPNFFPTEVWIHNGASWTQEINYAPGSAQISGIVHENASRLQSSKHYTGKDWKHALAVGFKTHRQNLIFTDEGGSSPMNTKVGPTICAATFMPEVNGAESAWAGTPTTYGDAGDYYLVADDNRATNPAGDDYIQADAASDKSRFGYQNFPGADPPSAVYGVAVVGDVNSGDAIDLTIFDTGGSQTGTLSIVNNRGYKMFGTAAGAAAWTEALVNSIEVRYERPAAGGGARRLYKAYVDVLCADMATNPTAVPEPTIPAAGRRRIGAAHGSDNPGIY